jgi:hypothetical protein
MWRPEGERLHHYEQVINCEIISILTLAIRTCSLHIAEDISVDDYILWWAESHSRAHDGSSKPLIGETKRKLAVRG